MRFTFHRHHPLNPLFGRQETVPLGSVRHTRAIWFFTPVCDIVVWL